MSDPKNQNIKEYILALAAVLSAVTGIVSNIESILSYNTTVLFSVISGGLWVYLIIRIIQGKGKSSVVVVGGVILIPVLVAVVFITMRESNKPTPACTEPIKGTSVAIANFMPDTSSNDLVATNLFGKLNQKVKGVEILGFPNYINPLVGSTKLKSQLQTLSRQYCMTKGIIVYGRAALDSDPQTIQCHLSFVSPDSMPGAHLRIDTFNLSVPDSIIRMETTYDGQLEQVSSFIAGIINYYKGDFEEALTAFYDAQRPQDELEASYSIPPARFASLPAEADEELHAIEAWSSFFIGNMYAYEGQYIDALNNYSKSILNDSANPGAYYNKAVVYQLIGDHEDAMRYYTKAHSLNASFTIPGMSRQLPVTEEEVVETPAEYPEDYPYNEPEEIQNTVDGTSGKPTPQKNDSSNNDESLRGKKAWSPFEVEVVIQDPHLDQMQNHPAFLDRYDSWKSGGSRTYIVEKDSKMSVLSQSGEVIAKMQYDKVRPYKNGRAAVKKGEEWGFIDIRGEEKVEVKYAEVRDFIMIGRMAVAEVRLRRNWLFVDVNGNKRSDVNYRK